MTRSTFICPWQDYMIYLYWDLSGREVMSVRNISTNDAGKISLNIGNLVQGSYMVKIAGGDKIYSQKLIVK